MPFLSLLDDRAKPKGSRDPLGFELVWTHYGRQVIGNLTTVTSSLNNFATALVGFKWANELCRHYPDDERQAKIRETFLRYEQLTGYLRYIGDDSKLMGVTRVAKRVQDTTAKISLGLLADEMILIDQASYGMWGLYSSAMRDTGLIRGEERSLTQLGETIAQRIEKKIDKQALLALVAKGGKMQRTTLQQHAKPFIRAIQNKSIQASLVETLMRGNAENVLQQELWQLTREQRLKGAIDLGVADFIGDIKTDTQNPRLKDRLQDIENIERLLVASNNLFHYCRRKDGESLKNILGALGSKDYIYAYLVAEQSLAGLPHGHILESIRSSLLAGNNQQALLSIFELNKLVMEQRGGAPWVELEPNKKLRVRVPSETSELCTQAQLEQGWDYEYFFSSYISMANQAPVS